jgi:hypothetical protein
MNIWVIRFDLDWPQMFIGGMAYIHWLRGAGMPLWAHLYSLVIR